VALIAIEEHWHLPVLTSAVKALPEDRGDPSLLFDEMGDNLGWGWHMEAAIAALRLIVRDTFDRHPSLQLVLGHWGGLLLFWTDRVDGISPIAGLDRKVSDYIPSNILTAFPTDDDREKFTAGNACSLFGISLETQ
jgi:hypothetical protein